MNKASIIYCCGLNGLFGGSFGARVTSASSSWRVHEGPAERQKGNGLRVEGGAGVPEDVRNRGSGYWIERRRVSHDIRKFAALLRPSATHHDQGRGWHRCVEWEVPADWTRLLRRHTKNKYIVIGQSESSKKRIKAKS